MQFSGRTLSHEKYPFTGDFGNTHAVPLTPEWGGGGGGAWSSHAISRPILIIAELNIHGFKEEELHSNVM